MKTKFFIYILIFVFTFSVRSACLQEDVGEAIAEGGIIAKAAPAEVKKAPYVQTGNVTVNFKDADIKAVLDYFSEVSGVDIVPAPDVSGPVTLKLTDKPWETALDILVKNYGYAYEREGNIIRVVTISSLKLEELSTEVIPLNYATAESARETIKDMLTPRGKITYDSRVNSLVVTDLATNIYKIKQVVRDLDKRTPQIMIEAKIIETVLNKTERLGIDWNIVIAASGARRPTTLPFTFGGYLPGFTPEKWNRYMPRPEGTITTTTTGEGIAITDTESPFPLSLNAPITQDYDSPFPVMSAADFTYGTLDFSQFSVILEYLKSRSDTDIISSPRITTLNNKEAKMFVGKVYYFISEIEEKEGAAGTEKWTYKVDKEEIGIRLLVTPSLSEIGDIVIKLKPEIKDVVGYQQITQYFSLPVFTTREAETQVMARDGDTIFIGGLIKENVTELDKKFPLLGDLFGDIPFIGKAFKYKSETKSKTELVFFLTVHVVKNTEELTSVAMKGMSEVKIPLDKKEEKPPFKKEKLIEIQAPALKKEGHRPLFDFRKKRK